MAGFPYTNFQGGDNQLMVPERTLWYNSSSTSPRTMFPMMGQEEGSSSEKRRRRSNRRENNVLARLYVRGPRIPRRPPSPAVPYRVINPTMTQFLFKKQLHRSDVGRVNRILLPKREAEEHLPYLPYDQGIWIHMDDMDYYQIWTINFRFWNNNNSGRIYIFENTRDLVTKHGLGVGDSIEVFRDIMSESFIIRATNTSGAPGLIHEQRLTRSKENDEFLCVNELYSAKNTSDQVGQGSSDLPNLVPVENNDVVLDLPNLVPLQNNGVVMDLPNNPVPVENNDVVVDLPNLAPLENNDVVLDELELDLQDRLPLEDNDIALDLPNPVSLNNKDAVLNQDQATIIYNEEIQQPALPAEPAQPAQPALDYGEQQEHNTVDNLLNDSFPTLDDDFEFFDIVGMEDLIWGSP